MTHSRVKIVAEPADVYRIFADNFLAQLEEAQSSTHSLNLILPVGPTAQYPLIAEGINNKKLSMKNLRIVLMDEYLDWQGRPLPSNHNLSFKGQFEKFLLMIDPKFRIQDSHWTIPDPFQIDRIDDFIIENGPIDTCYGGIGVHGHIAFNEPPISRYGAIPIEQFRNSETRVVVLAPETFTINALRGNHGKFSDFPQLAVTIGMKHILASRKIRLFADGGSRQHEAIRQFVSGLETVSYPITLLHKHEDVLIVVDENTGSELKK
jgi:glucosamine-6-phosphate deaminase